MAVGVAVCVALGLCALAGPHRASAQGSSLNGFVTDASTGQPLIGATVTVGDSLRRDLAAITNPDGYYQIGRIPAGPRVVRVTYVGFAAYTDTLIFGQEPVVRLSVALEPSDEELDEVLVEVEGGSGRLEAGLQTVRAEDLARIPTPDASGDLATYLQTLPGVVTVGDRGGALYIRGGTPDQNLTLLDGMLVYQPFHVVGLFSIFQEDLVSNVDVYAGGFGARYTGRTSSVIDVTMRDGNKQAFGGAVSLSPFLTSVRAEGPLRRGKSSILASVRSSVIEPLAPLVIGESLPINFGDQIVKLHGQGGENSFWSVTALHTYDQGRIDPPDVEDGDVFRWTNYALGGRLLSLPSTSRTLFEGHTAFSYVKNSVGSPQNPERFSSAAQLASEVNLSTLVGRSELEYGLFVRMNWLGYELAEQFANARTDGEMLLGAGGYLGTSVPFGPLLRVNPSVALTSYPSTFPISLEPRLRVAFTPGGGQELNAAFGLYRQTIVGVTDERDAGSPFIAWMAAPIGTVQTSAAHALTGWQGEFGPLLLAVEGYYKRLSNVHVPIWSTIARFTTTLTLASGDVYGLDARAEFQKKPLYLFVGYGTSLTEYQAKQENFGIWFGEPLQRYNPPHDRRHQVNAVVSLDFGKFRTSARWQFGSGLPYTRPYGFDDLVPLLPLIDVRSSAGTARVLFEKPFQGRLPTYHRLDVSAERTFTLSRADLTLQAGGINAYDRTNLFYYDIYTLRRVNQLPLVPYVSIKLETRP